VPTSRCKTISVPIHTSVAEQILVPILPCAELYISAFPSMRRTNISAYMYFQAQNKYQCLYVLPVAEQISVPIHTSRRRTNISAYTSMCRTYISAFPSMRRTNISAYMYFQSQNKYQCKLPDAKQISVPIHTSVAEQILGPILPCAELMLVPFLPCAEKIPSVPYVLPDAEYQYQCLYFQVQNNYSIGNNTPPIISL